MIEIYVTDEAGNRQRINDLYWFEENGVHDFEGEGHYGEKYTFGIYVNGVKVYPIEAEPNTLLGFPIEYRDDFPKGFIALGDFSLWVGPEKPERL